MATLIQHHVKGTGQIVTVILHHVDQPVNILIHLSVFLGSGAVIVILDGNGIGQFIIGQEFAVHVKDLASRTFDGLLLKYLQGKVVLIILTLHYLQHK